MPVYELINPSDPYTFEAPDLTTAGVVAGMLSPHFGAFDIDNPSDQTPVMFGWDEWLADRGVDDDWIAARYGVLAAAFDSFLIGDASQNAARLRAKLKGGAE
jgi:hypothetical protein